MVGCTLALTPPMGWNSWYIHYDRVTQDDVRAAADAMIRSGMANYGYQYINIDDGWMAKRGEPPYRGADGVVLPNKKFPDLKGLCDYIHAQGLKAGIYLARRLDLRRLRGGLWARSGRHRPVCPLGLRFSKYDLCGYKCILKDPNSREELIKPYKLVSDLLKKQDRDIVFNLCEYGMAEVWLWGGQVGNCWRTTGDLGLAERRNLPGFYEIGLSNARHHEYAKPGQWNDPDYLLIGLVGDAQSMGKGRPTGLTSDEQYSYMSMWCLMAAPLIFSGDMTKLDEFTLNVLCNAEMIAVDQDPLGRQAKIIAPIATQQPLVGPSTANTLILGKPMEDGSQVVGLFNLSAVSQTITVEWKDLGIAGQQTSATCGGRKTSGRSMADLRCRSHRMACR